MDPADVISLGAFDLLRPVARGGMARVWLGRHRQQGVPVAVKVLTGDSARQPDFVRRFQSEVRAVAALDHPGVVLVLDHGSIQPEASARHPELVDGAPWLAMEFVSGGTLAHLRPPLQWASVKTMALALLEALAHAHARGVIHRDLKPANVLLARKGDLRPGIRLTDFGIAWAGSPGIEELERVVGTPSYMAPEQIRGEWRDYGPWTDLYAFGCLMWWLTTGKAPFTNPDRDVTKVLQGHLHESPPEFSSPHPMPEGFSDWLERLLAKEWRHRFQFAADAAESLKALGEPEGVSGDDEVSLTPYGAADASMAPTITAILDDDWRQQVADSNLHPAPVTLPPHRPWVAPMPDDWRQRVPPQTPTQLMGAGLSLYGLRAVRLAGRTDERDRLWTELKRVAASGKARVVLVRGPSGTGKSFLAEWLGRRGHELGVLHTCKATFSRDKAPGEALRDMAIDYVRTQGLTRRAVRERALAFLRQGGGGDRDEVEVLTELMCPATPEDLATGDHAVRLTNPREYYMGTANAFYRVSRDRPLLAWFDDVQWGQHGIRLAMEVLRTQGGHPFPCLVLLTLRDEALEEGSDEERQLERLMELDGASEIRLGPLAPTAHRDLVRGLLRLDDDLAARVEERTRGNPLFAIQLVGSWVHDGTLEVGPDGFRLKPGARVRLPDDLHDMWSRQLAMVLAEYPEQTQRYLEVGACLGTEVKGDEWGRACDDPEGLFTGRFPTEDQLRARLIERLKVLHLAVGTPRRWAFVHGMLQESLLRTAEEAGRLKEHHVSCAAMLASQGQRPVTAERLGNHLVSAGDLELAVEPLLVGVEHRLATVGAGPARRLLATVVQVMADVDLPKTDPRWGRLWTVQAQVMAELGQVGDALAYAIRAGDAAREHGWSREELTALLAEARLLLRMGRSDDAEARFERLEALARSRGDAARRGAAWAGLARLAWRRSDPKRTVELQDLALTAFEEMRQRGPAQGADAWNIEYARILLQRGRSSQALGSPVQAATMFRQALEQFEALGSGVGSAECLDRLGTLAMEDVRFEEAVRLFTRALSRYEALGSERAVPCRMQLAQAMLQTSPAKAWPVAARLEPTLAHLSHDARVTASQGLRLLKAALEQQGEKYDKVLPEVVSGVSALSRAGDGAAATLLAWMAQLSGEAWRVHGNPDRAMIALRGASAIWRALGRPEKVSYIEGLLPAQGA